MNEMEQLTPNYISIKINGKNQQCQKTIQAATRFRLNQFHLIHASN